MSIFSVLKRFIYPFYLWGFIIIICNGISYLDAFIIRCLHWSTDAIWINIYRTLTTILLYLCDIIICLAEPHNLYIYPFDRVKHKLQVTNFESVDFHITENVSFRLDHVSNIQTRLRNVSWPFNQINTHSPSRSRGDNIWRKFFLC